MTQYDNTNRGAIWKNDRKEKDTHPDFKGELDVEGVTYWVSAWKRKPDASDKSPALSFSIQKKENKAPQVQQQFDAAGSDFEDDPIPFAPHEREFF